MDFRVLLLLALPVASVSWTVTHEEILREPREWLVRRSRTGRSWFARKVAFALTCEYCFSHYVAAFFVYLAGFQLLLPGWRGYLIAWFSVVWVANFYMGLYGLLRLDIKHERVEIEAKETEAGRKPRV